MAVLSDYVSGTISLTNGSVDFTGSGTGWLLAGFKEGDTILDITGATQFTGVIASISANGAGKLTRPWEGPTLVDVPYRMRYQPDGSRVSAQARNLVELLGNGNLQAEAQIDGTGGNWLSYFTGAGAKARTAFTAFARSLLGAADAATARQALNAQVAGDYQPAGNYQAALGFIPVNKAGDTGLGTLGITGNINLAGQINGQNSNTPMLRQAHTITLGNNAAIIWPNFSGLMIVNNLNDGGIGVWIGGGGSIVPLGVAGTLNGLDGLYAQAQNGYAVFNSGPAKVVSAIALQTRDSA